MNKNPAHRKVIDPFEPLRRFASHPIRGVEHIHVLNHGVAAHRGGDGTMAGYRHGAQSNRGACAARAGESR